MGGGAIETVARISYPGVTATWYNDSIIFTHAGQLFRVSAHGGVAEPVTPPPGPGQPAFFSPAFLPGGNAVLASIWSGSGPDDSGVGAVDLRRTRTTPGAGPHKRQHNDRAASAIRPT